MDGAGLLDGVDELGGAGFAGVVAAMVVGTVVAPVLSRKATTLPGCRALRAGLLPLIEADGVSQPRRGQCGTQRGIAGSAGRSRRVRAC